jgi:putative endonuclease
LSEHNYNKSPFTSKKGPWKLVFKKEFNSRSEAIKFENYLKSLKNKKYILEKYCSISR